jgi:hypothetical protein
MNIRNHATWGNIRLADERAALGHFATKEAFETYVMFLEDWDEAREEDKDRNPDICDYQDIANVGYGPDEVMRCGHKATHLVTFDSFSPETDEWDHIRLNVCTFHARRIASESHPAGKDDMTRNWYIAAKMDETVSANKS